MDGPQELIGDPGDGDVRDLELLFPEEMEQEVERTGERVELDDESGAGAERGRRERRELVTPAGRLRSRRPDTGRLAGEQVHHGERRRQQKCHHGSKEKHQREEGKISESLQVTIPLPALGGRR